MFPIKAFNLCTPFLEDYDESLKNRVPICTTDDSANVKNKSCEFPFKYKGVLYNECITEKDKITEQGGRPWCATEVGKRRKLVRGKWGNCDNTTCQSLNFESTTSLFTGILCDFR